MMAGMGAQALLALACLAGVVLLILGAARAARALPGLAAPQAQGAPVLRGSLALDRGRRLHVVEAAGSQIVVLTGGTADAMLALQPRP